MGVQSRGAARGYSADHRPPARVIVLRIGVPIVALLVSVLPVLLWAGVETFDLGDPAGVYPTVMFFVVAAVCGFFFFWSSWPWTGMLVAGLIFFSAMAAGSAIQNIWLERFGETGGCQVTTVDQRTYREWVSGGDGDGGHYESRVVYRHHLQCPAGGPSELSRARILAYNGETLQVVWDRTGRVGPLAASERRSSWESWRTLLLMYGIASLALLTEALIDLARYPRRSRWDFGGWGFLGGSFMGGSFMGLARNSPR